MRKANLLRSNRMLKLQSRSLVDMITTHKDDRLVCGCVQDEQIVSGSTTMSVQEATETRSAARVAVDGEPCMGQGHNGEHLEVNTAMALLTVILRQPRCRRRG